MNKRILIVDDSLTVRMDLQQTLQSSGLETEPCATIHEARKALRSGPAVVLAILDVNLPDGNGVDFLTEIRATPGYERLPVIMLSTEAEVHDRVRGLKTGANEYVGKPYDSKYILARARELMGDGEKSAGGNPLVLVIDDSATYREALRSALEEADYAVETASTGEEGLALAANIRPNAIIVDGQMPGIDGATVIRRVRFDAALRGTPCMLMTASEGREVETAMLDAGADAFIHKDEDMNIVLARLAAVLRRAEPIMESQTRSLLSAKRVLAVDDSVTFLHALAENLRTEGYDVVLAKSGEEAIEVLGVQAFDCILLDMIMPGMSGQETCQRIKESRVARDVPVIMLTAMEDKRALIDGLTSGADDFISKSSDMEVVKARVRAQIRRRQFEEENRRIRDQLLETEIEVAESKAARELAGVRASLIEELEAKNKELDSFTYSVSHDLRAPLRAIEGFSKVLIDDYSTQMPDQAQHYLRRVQDNARRMGCLIDDLLAFSRLGRQPLAKSSVDMNALVREVLAQLQVQREQDERDIELIFADLPPAQADHALLVQVYANLISNALKYSRKKPKSIVEFGVNASNGSPPVYWVRDNGAGFNMKYVNKLFGVFQRLHRADEFEGTGVGLALSHRIVSRHGGKMWAEGEPDNGAIFYFTLQGESS